jgi:RHS repeat-associated protein
MPPFDQPRLRSSRNRSRRWTGARFFVAGTLALALTATLADVPAAPAAAAPAPKPAAVPCPPARPDEAAALVTARVCGGEVKIAGLTNGYDEAWAQPDGQVRWEHHYRPVRVKRNGAWTAVDTTLRLDADGVVRPANTAVGLEFSGGGSAPMVAITEGGGKLQLGSPVGALPRPVLTGDTATYQDVLPGVDLTMRADVEGYEQVLVVRNRQAAANPRLARLGFKIGTRNLKVAADAGGNIRATGPNGKLRFAGNTPLMWDAAAEQTAGGTGRTGRMRSGVSGGQIRVTPDKALLSDPATVYPVYLDPGVTAAKSAWTKVDAAFPTTSYWNSSGDAPVGPSGASKFRSFFNLNVGATPIKGKYVTKANFVITETHSYSCQATPVELWATAGAGSATTWNNQPAFSSLQSSQTVAKGYSAACPAGPVVFPATTVVQTAANSGWQNVTLALRAPDETVAAQLKRFNNNPTLQITYTSYPTVGTRGTAPSTSCVTGSGRPYVNTATPQLQARIVDADGDTVRPEFEWSAVGGTKIGSAQPIPAKASGQQFTAAVPAGAFVNGNSYSWRVRGNDSTVWGPWSAGCEFTVDTTAPSAAPTVTSTAYPENQWAGTLGTAGTFTLGAAGVSDVAAYVYGLDDDPATVVNTSALAASATITVTPDEEGQHTLKVQSRDRGGNLSPAKSYTFYVGAGAVTAPAGGDQSAGKVTLSGLGRSTTTGVTYHWRRGDADAWTTIPAADITSATGASIAWPVATSGAGNYPDLVWNLAQTVNTAEPGLEPLNGPVQVRASFTGGTGGTSSGAMFTLDRDKTEASTAEIGPGEVNLLTGNYQTTAVDAATVGGLAVQRTLNTRTAGETDPMFGPGWTSSVKAPEAGSYTKLSVAGSLVQVGLADGTTLGFTKKATTSTGAIFAPQAGAEGTALTYTTSGDSYRLVDRSGDAVTFSNQVSATYAPTALKAYGGNSESRMSWEKVTLNGTTVIRPTQLLAALPDGVPSCAPMVRGCQALSFAYATATTATGTTPGDHVGRIQQISLTAWDPDLSTPAMRTVVMARYSYDTTGRLRAAWDPRLNYISAGLTKQVATQYTYNADGTIATLTPPAEEPWQFTYTTVPGDSGTGRLYKATRSALNAGTAVHTVVYRTRISGAGAPVDMAALINRWGQTVLPVDATAVYPADIVPDGDPATGTLPSWSDDDRVTVMYMDANGREINTMNPGGTVSAVWRDKYGNTVRELDGGNLAEALWRSESDTPAQEAAYAQRESTLYVYSADGQRLLETWQPERVTALPDGQTVRGRTHAVRQYDQGAPSGTSYDLVTSETKSLQYVLDGATVDTDKRTTATKYDWTLKQPTEITVDPAGLALTTRSSYNSAGQVTSTTTPAGDAAGSTPSTRRTVYYRAGTGSGYPECDSHAEWAGLECRVFTAAQPTGLPVPFTVTTYDMYGQARTVTEKTDTTLRTSTVDMDAAGRERELTTTSSLGTAIERRRIVYDDATGQAVGTQTLSSTGAVTSSIATAYDTLGRLMSYTDADNVTSLTTYDVRSRPLTETDGKGTRTYSYDTDAEKRGLATQVIDSQAGTFGATYDNFGNLVTEVRPDGATVNRYYDETGNPVGLEYTTGCSDPSCALYYEYADIDAHGKRSLAYTSLNSVDYSYDGAGRVTGVMQETAAGCTRRGYTFDSSTNRKQLSTYAPEVDGSCQTTSATTRSWNHDAADRVTTPVHAMDALGRTLTVPSADIADGTAGDVQMTYYANDMTRSISGAAAQATYTLDVPADRYRGYTVTTGGVTNAHTYHYSDETDKPSWIAENGWYTRRVEGMSGLSAFVTGPDAHLEWQIINLHGDVVATQLAGSPGLAQTSVTDEYGRPVNGSALRYGYLGGEQRSADNPGGLISMGVRVYNPGTGRFLSTDPVYGGNSNAYDYCSGDAVNCTDISGKYSTFYFSCRKSWRSTHRTKHLRGYNYNIRCDLGHGWFTSGGYLLAAIGGGVGGAIGAMYGSWVGGLAGGVIGALVGGLMPWWYSTWCTRNDGAQLRGTIKRRWHFVYGPRFDTRWGYALTPRCH